MLFLECALKSFHLPASNYLVEQRIRSIIESSLLKVLLGESCLFQMMGACICLTECNHSFWWIQQLIMLYSGSSRW